MSLYETGLDLDSLPVVWQADESGFALFLVAICGIAEVIDLTVIYALCRDKNIPLDSQIIISLCLSDALLALVYLFIISYNSHKHGYYIGSIGCFLNAALCIYFAGCSILSITMLATYRYLVSVKNYHPTQTQVSAMLAVIWIGTGGAIFSFTPVWKRIVALQSGNYFCYLADWSSDVFPMAATFLLLTIFLIAFAWIVYVYAAIVWKYYRYQSEKALQRFSING